MTTRKRTAAPKHKATDPKNSARDPEPEKLPEVVATPADDIPEFVAWWNPATGRYVGGRHRSTEEAPAWVELHPWGTAGDLTRPS